MNKENCTFGQMIQNLRRKRGLNIKDLIKLLEGKELNVSPSYMTRIEVHHEIPSPKLTCALADVLEYDVEELTELAKRDKHEQNRQRIDEKYDAGVVLYKKEKKTR